MCISRAGYAHQTVLEDANEGFSHSAVITMPGLLKGEIEQSFFSEDPGSTNPIKQHCLLPACNSGGALPIRQGQEQYRHGTLQVTVLLGMWTSERAVAPPS